MRGGIDGLLPQQATSLMCIQSRRPLRSGFGWRVAGLLYLELPSLPCWSSLTLQHEAA